MREARPRPIEPSRPPPRPDLLLRDLAGLVHGYALAGLLVRSFWPASRQVNARVAVVVAVFYLWLGLAMTGPVLVVLGRLRPGAGDERKWSELAWIGTGCYWLALLVAGQAGRGSPIGSLYAGLPIVVAMILVLLVGGTGGPAGARRPWTERAAAVLLWTWPLAWLCLILIGQTLG